MVLEGCDMVLEGGEEDFLEGGELVFLEGVVLDRGEMVVEEGQMVFAFAYTHFRRFL